MFDSERVIICSATGNPCDHVASKVLGLDWKCKRGFCLKKFDDESFKEFLAQFGADKQTAVPGLNLTEPKTVK